MEKQRLAVEYYIIPSDNWEQQLYGALSVNGNNYIIPSDNWEQQLTVLL